MKYSVVDNLNLGNLSAKASTGSYIKKDVVSGLTIYRLQLTDITGYTWTAGANNTMNGLNLTNTELRPLVNTSVASYLEASSNTGSVSRPITNALMLTDGTFRINTEQPIINTATVATVAIYITGIYFSTAIGTQ